MNFTALGQWAAQFNNFFLSLDAVFTLDEVVSWWSILSSFMSSNWGNIKYITEKAWLCSQGGVGKLFGWLMCEQNLASGTSCLLQRAGNTCITAQTCRGCTQGRCGCGSQGVEQRDSQSTRVDLIIWQYFFLACPFLSFSLSHLTSSRQFCELQPLTVLQPSLQTNCRKCQGGSFSLSAPYLPQSGLGFPLFPL